MLMQCLKSVTDELSTTDKDGLITKTDDYLLQMRNFRKDGNHNGTGVKEYDKLMEETIVWKRDEEDWGKKQKTKKLIDTNK